MQCVEVLFKNLVREPRLCQLRMSFSSSRPFCAQHRLRINGAPCCSLFRVINTENRVSAFTRVYGAPKADHAILRLRRKIYPVTPSHSSLTPAIPRAAVAKK